MEQARQHWQHVCARLGWVSCSVVKDKDHVAFSHRESATSSLSVGIPHPQHGIMRLTMCLTSATSLTRLVGVAARATDTLFDDAPHLFVGDREYRDTVQGTDSMVLGVLLFRGPTGDVQSAPMTAVDWRGMWLPYFEDANDWVMTGWDARGHVVEEYKPLGWGCPPLHHDVEGQASCMSRVSGGRRSGAPSTSSEENS